MRGAGIAASARRSITGNDAGRAAARRTLLRYIRGPVRARDNYVPAGCSRHVVLVLRSDSFAGVERYVCDVAAELYDRGWKVTVIGGERSQMRAELPAGVNHRSGDSLAQVLRELWKIGSCDVVHAHMTAAELPAALLKSRLGGRLVVTRHFAQPRGRSRLGVLAAVLIRRRVDAQVSVSDFVARTIGEPSITVPAGVTTSSVTEPRQDVVVLMQRLEPEKDTATAIRAWAASPLPALGWNLVVYGRGSQLGQLRHLARSLDCTSSVQFAGYTRQPRLALAHAAALLASAPAEPFGLAVVEAMAEATPVIAARGGAHLETLGEDGLFFDAGDVDSCVKVLTELARIESLSALGLRLRERQRARFTTKGHVEQLERIFGF